MKRQIILTKDGSHTVEIPELQVAYHSHNGALQESVHVFIEAGLRFVAGHTGQANTASTPLRIFEMGFGTGLNAYLTALEAYKLQIPIHYTAIEPYPLGSEEIALLNYAATEADRELFSQLHQAPWQEDVPITPLFTLHKQQTALFQFNIAAPVHLIYYDAFAPSAQPELWTESTFSQLHRMLVPGGVLVTYCSKSVVRRAMQAAGFTVTKIPGPRGKREMVRASTPCPPEGGT
ncbi:tRNA U34 5-methylaminomethyl-2-thiouridine-forming methyltransferase MnmC [Cnuella takakiae]|uniref:tRNA U34 5-methylaminomethyl-2-thiouridine-forming methyltransferase MnmC n=1 Tax=Cnuella takakiae TaxID=1302690 RepID=A0A1M5GV14_9BACT|nr:tRNA (5-methylaminomethyl-2-thiouridine)(34)-methyltransferase MnmD [Cnuella takakiae]OLY90875.1 hypothetical protein BUE76_02420 [Cnuella takakiae]SHG07604.1 tRNA U34 5-methylaminomethyl-2-thiouridine-forming methyltransferase MnmC [Cnuella takakiae]